MIAHAKVIGIIAAICLFLYVNHLTGGVLLVVVAALAFLLYFYWISVDAVR